MELFEPLLKNLMYGDVAHLVSLFHQFQDGPHKGFYLASWVDPGQSVNPNNSKDDSLSFFQSCTQVRDNTVDGRNPAPPGMYKTL